MMSWQYLAGFFDGEGHVGISGRNMRCTITQKHPEVLLHIQEFLRQHGIHSDLGASTEHAYVLTIAQRLGIRKFLRHVRPYLVVKKVAAEDHWRYLTIWPPRWSTAYAKRNLTRVFTTSVSRREVL